MMYETTDKVKTFHRTLLLSDVLAEREMQRGYKARRTALQAEAEAAYIVQRDAALEVALEVETAKLVAAKVPNLTAVAPERLVPVTVTRVPPATGPAVGLTDVTVGAPT